MEPPRRLNVHSGAIPAECTETFCAQTIAVRSANLSATITNHKGIVHYPNSFALRVLKRQKAFVTRRLYFCRHALLQCFLLFTPLHYSHEQQQVILQDQAPT